MKPTVNLKSAARSSVMALSLLALLSTAACGKRRDKDEDKKGTAPKVTVAPRTTKSDSQPKNLDLSEKETDPSKVSAADLEPIFDYDPLDPNNVVRADKRKRLTGARDDRGLVYTDASSDYLLTYLRLRADEATDPIIKERNLKFAMSIASVKVQKDDLGLVTLKLKLRQEGSRQEKEVVLSGKTDLESRKVELKTSSQLANTADKMTAELRCVDLNQETCETSFLRLVSGLPGQRAYAAVVVRNTEAKLKVDMSMEDSYNQEFKYLRDTFVNTMFNDSGDKFKSIRVSSWSVVNGKSNFSLKMVSEYGEVISFGGALLAPNGASTEVNLVADRNLSKADLSDDESIERRSTRINDYIDQVRIVNNNGLGQVKAELTMSYPFKNEKQIIDVTIVRVLKPVLHISEDSLYFNK